MSHYSTSAYRAPLGEPSDPASSALFPSYASVVQDPRQSLGMAALDDPEAIRTRFDILASAWRASPRIHSSPRRLLADPFYGAIVRLGPAAIPLILAELQVRPDRWFWALYVLTGADPVKPEDRGNVDAMAAAWVRWGKMNGYL